MQLPYLGRARFPTRPANMNPAAPISATGAVVVSASFGVCTADHHWGPDLRSREAKAAAYLKRNRPFFARVASHVGYIGRMT